MPLLEIDKDKCIGCGGCIDSCPFGALSLVDDLVVVNDKCTACGACLLACPVHALNLPDPPSRKSSENLAAYRGVWIWMEQFHGRTGIRSYDPCVSSLVPPPYNHHITPSPGLKGA